MLSLLLAIFIAKSVDVAHNRVTVEAMFPVQVELEVIQGGTPSKGEVFTECKIVKLKVENPDDNPYELHCKDKRNFKVKSIAFSEGK